MCAASPVGGFWDNLSKDETDFVESIIAEIMGHAWADPIITSIADNRGITQANKDRLFELRFGYALHREGVVPRYEIEGEGQSTIDFGFTSKSQSWAVELLRLGETQAVKDATKSSVDESGIKWKSWIFSTDADDPTQSTEGETLKAVQRICQKCERDGRPHKFPAPQSAYHAILVDFRTFLNGGDVYDRIHVGLGGERVARRYRLNWHGQVISGVFDERTAVRGAAEVRQRVHFLGFVREREFKPGEFARATQFIANPYLVPDAAGTQAAIATWPLQPAEVLNDGA